MTINDTFFWDGSRTYGQDELEIMVESFMCSGVRNRDTGMDLKPSIDSGGTAIILQQGDALSGGHYYHSSGETSWTPSSSCYGKKCSLFIRTTWTSKTTSPVIVAGTSSTYPSRVKTVGTTYDIRICNFTVSSTGTISNLIDTRANSSECGEIRARGFGELDEFLTLARSRFDSWFEALEDEVGGMRVLTGSSTPSDEESIEGSLWIDTNTWSIRKYSTANEWGNMICTVKPYHLVGLKMSGDEVRLKGQTIEYIPFNTVQEGYVTSADYAQYMTNTDGKIHILKSGVYQVTCHLRIKDGANTQKFNLSLRKQTAKAFVEFGECVADTNEKDMSMTICTSTMLLKDEIISAQIHPRGGGAYRIAADESHFEVWPVKIF